MLARSIAANILARPLCTLAAGLCRHLAPGGHLILSGFIAGDGNRVLAANRCRGVTLVRRITLDGWQTLVLRKTPRAEPHAQTAGIASFANGDARQSRLTPPLPDCRVGSASPQ